MNARWTLIESASPRVRCSVALTLLLGVLPSCVFTLPDLQSRANESADAATGTLQDGSQDIRSEQLDDHIAPADRSEHDAAADEFAVDAIEDQSHVDVNSTDAHTQPDSNPVLAARSGLFAYAWTLDKRSASNWIRDAKGVSNATSYSNRPTLVVSVCGAEDGGTSGCWFPLTRTYADITFKQTSVVTDLVAAADSDGTVDVILDVSPNHAKVADLIRALSLRFKANRSVKGISVTWAWIAGDANPKSELSTWVSLAQSQNPQWTLHLLGWDVNAYGTYRNKALSYGYAGGGFDTAHERSAAENLVVQRDYLAHWVNQFKGYEVALYWGFDADRWWLEQLTSSSTGLKHVQDAYFDTNPSGWSLLAAEELYFALSYPLPTSPMR